MKNKNIFNYIENVNIFEINLELIWFDPLGDMSGLVVVIVVSIRPAFDSLPILGV